PAIFGILSACFGAGALLGALLAAGLGRASTGVLPRRDGRLRGPPARARAGALGGRVRPAPLRDRRLLHALDVELELVAPARRARPPPRPRGRPLLLLLPRRPPRRRPARRL